MSAFYRHVRPVPRRDEVLDVSLPLKRPRGGGERGDGQKRYPREKQTRRRLYPQT